MSHKIFPWGPISPTLKTTCSLSSCHGPMPYSPTAQRIVIDDVESTIYVDYWRVGKSCPSAQTSKKLVKQRRDWGPLIPCSRVATSWYFWGRGKMIITCCT